LAECESRADAIQLVDELVDFGSRVDLLPLGYSDAEQQVGIRQDSTARVQPDKDVEHALYHVETLQRHANELPNLQLLEGAINNEKRTAMPAEWLAKHLPDPTAQIHYRTKHELGDLPIDAHRPLPNVDAPLIASQRHRQPFSTVTLSTLFKEIYELAGIRTSSHSGRRTFATRLNAKGIGMRTIQKLMGHQHISTTELYCDVSDDMLRNAVEVV
jgi:integrase